jgi:hypothetical protein
MIHRYRKVDQIPELFAIFSIVGIEVIRVVCFNENLASRLLRSDAAARTASDHVYRLLSGKMTSGAFATVRNRGSSIDMIDRLALRGRTSNCNGSMLRTATT